MPVLPQVVARVPVRIALQAILVEILGGIEICERDHLRHDGTRPFGLSALDGAFGGVALRVVVVENCGAVLRADVVALAVCGRRIVQAEEKVEDVVVRNLRRIELDLQRLGVAGAAGFHVRVARVVERAAGVADSRVDHAGQRTNELFDAPEAAAGECGGLRHLCASFLNRCTYSPYPSASSLSTGMKRSDAEFMQ